MLPKFQMDVQKLDVAANGKTLPFAVFASILFFLIVVPPACWAHGSKPDPSKETCGSIRLAAEENIRKLSALRVGAQSLANASNLVVFTERLMGKTVADPGQEANMRMLRQDIERDKDTLRARGCDTQELDTALSSLR